jgi:hypothetical protein
MDRGVIVGGGLIAASFLVAVLLNRSAHQEVAPVTAPRQPPTTRACDDPEQRATGSITQPDNAHEDCERLRVEALQR